MKSETKRRKILLRCLITVGAVIIIFILLRIIIFPPNPYKNVTITGEHEVKITEFTWTDESRVETFTDTGEKRALTVKFWYPEEEGSYPLVVFSHGAFGIIDSNYSTCMELASNGYVVASIGHPYHAMFVKDVNGKVTIADMNFVKSMYEGNGTYDPEAEKKSYENSKEWMKLRVDDENFVLDTILDKSKAGENAPFSLIDTEKIGLFGHSMGGASSVQLGRMREDIDAVIDLEGTMMGEYAGFENGMEIYNEEPYPVPLLDVNGRRVYEMMQEMKAELPDSLSDWQYVNFYVGENAADYRAVIFNDTGHLNFTDLPLVSPVLAKLLGVGKVRADACIGNVNEIVLDYFDYYLKDKGELNLKSEY